jgi:hypothetical protein
MPQSDQEMTTAECDGNFSDYGESRITTTQDVQTDEGLYLSMIPLNKLKIMARKLLFKKKRKRLADKKRRRELRRQNGEDGGSDSSMSFQSNHPVATTSPNISPDGTTTKPTISLKPPSPHQQTRQPSVTPSNLFLMF